MKSSYEAALLLLTALSTASCATSSSGLKRTPSSTPVNGTSRLKTVLDCTTNSINPFAANAIVESGKSLSSIQVWHYFQGTVADDVTKPNPTSTGVLTDSPKAEESKSSRINTNDIAGEPIHGLTVIFVLGPGNEIVLPNGFENIKPKGSAISPVFQASWFQYDAGDPDDGAYTPATCSVNPEYVSN